MPYIPENIIVAWPGTTVGPFGWSRETALDSKYIKGWTNTVDPGTSGGALTHKHATVSHSHTVNHTHTIPDSGTASTNSNRDINTTNPLQTHTHLSNGSTDNPEASYDLAAATPDTSTDNNEPACFDVIYLKSGGAAFGIPDGAICLWTYSTTAVPSGWQLCNGSGGAVDCRSRFLRGAVTAGDGGGTGGNDAHVHTVVNHDHGGTRSHVHPTMASSTTAAGFNTAGSISGTTAFVATSSHTHTLTFGSTSPVVSNQSAADDLSSEANIPPYTTVGFIQNVSGSVSTPDRIICLWIGTLATIPTNWYKCDGTNGTMDLRDMYPRCCATLAGIGGTGGTLTHTHTAEGHTHPVAAHTHTVTAGVGANASRTAGAVVTAASSHVHTFAATGSSSFTSGSTTPTVSNYTVTQPPYYQVCFVEYHEPASGNRRRRILICGGSR